MEIEISINFTYEIRTLLAKYIYLASLQIVPLDVDDSSSSNFRIEGHQQ